MKKIVLVTGAGGQAGINVIKALINQGYDVVAVDADGLASGLYLTQRRHVIPLADYPQFPQVLMGLCKKEKVDYLVPTVTPEFFPIAEHANEFHELGVKILMSNTESVEKTYNKLLTSKELARANIPAPKFGDPSTESIDSLVDRVGFPMFLKPIRGSGSRGTSKVMDREDLEFVLKRASGLIAQEFLDGTEYTVDCLYDENSSLIAHVPRERIEVKAGYSVKGVTVKNSAMEKVSARIGKKFKLQYAACIQYIVGNDGTPKVVEINPRFSGGLSLSIEASGINIPDVALRMLEGETFERLIYNEGVQMTRHFTDIYISDGRVSFPSDSSDRIYQPRVVLAIGAHPDDIEIGCGGALITHKDNGHKVYGLVLTDGEMGGNRKTRLGEAERSAEALGLDGLCFLHLSDARVTDDLDTVTKIRDRIYRVRPDTIYTHTEKDSHQDHRNSSRAVRSAARGVARILLFEDVRTQSEFTPHVYIELTKSALEKKIAALLFHKSQEGKSFIVDHVRSMAEYWGHRQNTRYVEAFELNHLMLRQNDL